MRDRKFITYPRDTPGLCTRWKTWPFGTSPLRTRFCTQRELQFASLPSLLTLQSGMTSRISQKLSPKIQIMLTTKLQILYGLKEGPAHHVYGTGKEMAALLGSNHRHCSHHLKHVTKKQSIENTYCT